jgi:hypothetical protein
LLPYRGSSAGIFSGDTKIQTADIPQSTGLSLLTDSRTADTDTAAATEGDKSLCQILLVTVNRIGAYCLKAAGNILRSGTKRSLRL